MAVKEPLRSWKVTLSKTGWLLPREIVKVRQRSLAMNFKDGPVRSSYFFVCLSLDTHCFLGIVMAINLFQGIVDGLASSEFARMEGGFDPPLVMRLT